MKAPDLISERILFGAIILIGYFAVGGLGSYWWGDGRHSDALSLTRDVLLTIGPLLGVMVNSIWKNDRTDTQRANTAAILAAKSPDLSTSTVSAPPVEAPAEAPHEG